MWTGATAVGTDIRVPDDSATIQGAIDLAVAGDTIIVAAGQYIGSINFNGKSLALIGEAGAANTEIQATDVAAITARDVADITISGFTIIGLPSTASPVGGIDATGSSGTIEQNVIGPARGCRAAALEVLGAMTVRHNVIWGADTPTCAAGAERTPILVGGGGAIVSDNLITNNTATAGGGLTLAGAAVVERNLIVDNNVGLGNGGGIFVRDGAPAGEMIVQNNLIQGNSSQRGSGLDVVSADGLLLRNNTIARNTVSITADDPTVRTPLIANNIFDGQFACATTNAASTGTFTRNAFIVRRSSTIGTCFSSPPPGNLLHANAAYQSLQFRDYHLLPWSTLVDFGNGPEAPADDFDGDPRPIDGDRTTGALPDIGFDEVRLSRSRPDTQIVSGPDDYMDPAAPRAFVFTSDVSTATFECNVDRAGWKACTSPFAMPGTEQRIHSFEVRAKTGAGVDASPAMRLVKYQPTWLGKCTQDGTDGDDTLSVAVFGAVLCGRGGNDVLTITAGPGTVDGGSGNDVLAIRNGSTGNTLIGGDGDFDTADLTTSNPTNIELTDPFVPDWFYGANTDNIHWTIESVWAGPSDNDIRGNLADNVIDGGYGADTMHGGPGFDWVDYRPATSRVRVDLTGSRGNDGFPNEHDTVDSDIEGILGGRAGDILLGNNQGNEIWGYNGPDLITPGRGGDDAYGGPGDDTIVANDEAADYIECGSGRDVAIVNRSDYTIGCEERMLAPNPFTSTRVHWANIANLVTSSASRGVTGTVACATNRVSVCRVRTTAVARPVIGGRVVSVPIGSVTTSIPRTHGAATIRIRLSRAARNLFTTRSRVRVNVRVFLRTGSTFVRKRSITFTMRKVAATASYNLQGVDREKAIPQNPRDRSAGLMPAAGG